MIEIKTKKPKIAIDYADPTHIQITFIASKHIAESLENLDSNKDLILQVKEYREKRTLSQNAYLWVLLDKIAQEIGRSKEEIYRHYVKDYGVCEILPLREDAVEKFKSKWEKNGLGWFVEIIGSSKLENYINVIAYYGSSTYDTKEMSRLMEAVVQDCKDMGIQTLTQDEINLLENNN